MDTGVASHCRREIGRIYRGAQLASRRELSIVQWCWNMIAYSIGTSGQNLVFSPEVLAHFDRYRQRHSWSSEAGGLLFARLSPPTINVVVATGPRRTDKRTRYSYHPDRRAEQREIDSFHKQDLHFVGEWHTHPERYPAPSPLDRKSMIEAVGRSRHQLNAFVLTIIGQASFPAGLYVSVFDAETNYVLSPTIEPEDLLISTPSPEVPKSQSRELRN